MTDAPRPLDAHYDALAAGGGESLVARLQAAFRNAGLDPWRLTLDEVAGIDQLHLGGRGASRSLAQLGEVRPLVEMDTDSDEDSYIMEESILSDFLEDEKQKLVFVFDYINDRAFYIELSEIIPGKSLKSPICTLSQGKAPLQSVELDDTTVISNSISDIDDTFFGDESFNPDELDSEGFEDIEDIAESFGESDLI